MSVNKAVSAFKSLGHLPSLSTWMIFELYNILDCISIQSVLCREAIYDDFGDPAEDEVCLCRISPLFYTDNIKRPLLVIQGANDAPVPQAESDKIVEVLRCNGVPVIYLFFEHKGHGSAPTRGDRMSRSWQ